jgi:predicted amidohydrolase YtcJ
MSKRWCLAILVSFLFLPLGLDALAAQVSGLCADAELVVNNAKIVTMDNGGQLAEAAAVREGKIVAVGSNDEITACAGERTEMLDLGGKTVLPGLIDVHTHAIDWAKAILRDEIDANFPKVRTVADIVEKVRQRAEAAEPGEWIVGYGWDDAKLEERRYVTKQDVDSVSPENPVYLVHVSGHLSLANSVALKLAGITVGTQDPEGGLIERDAAGEPTGILKDTAMPMVARLLPGDPPDLPGRAAKVVSEQALEVGLTTIHDIWISAEDRDYTRGSETTT